MNATRPHWWPAYVGIGSNLDDPAAHTEHAFASIHDLPQTRLVLRSPLYASAPVGPQDQPDYVNAVAAVLTQLKPDELLAALHKIEQVDGRTRGGERWGARTLDLDLLVYGTEVIDTPALTVPHPRIAERNFVLLPLNDIAPNLRVPGLGPVAALATRVSKTEPRIKRLV